MLLEFRERGERDAHDRLRICRLIVTRASASSSTVARMERRAAVPVFRFASYGLQDRTLARPRISHTLRFTPAPINHNRRAREETAMEQIRVCTYDGPGARAGDPHRAVAEGRRRRPR